MDAQEDQRRAKLDLERQRGEAGGLTAEVQALRERLDRERIETSAVAEQYTRRAETLTQENKRLEMKLMRTQLRESAKDSEASEVKREVLDKTAQIEKALRELQQHQQATLAKVKSLATSMLTACSAPPPREGRTGSSVSSVAGARVEVGGELLSVLGGRLPGEGFGSSLGLGNGRLGGSGASAGSKRAAALAAVSEVRPASAGASPERGRGAPPGQGSDADAQRWFQSVKANLEHFGDVDVFTDGSSRECACCCEQMNTDYRIRPRKCLHVFHIECMLQWWTEGTCPVCGVNFAPEQQRPPMASSESGAWRSLSPSQGSRGNSAGGRGAGSMSPLLSRPAGIPGPGTFGGGDLPPGSPLGGSTL